MDVKITVTYSASGISVSAESGTNEVELEAPLEKDRPDHGAVGPLGLTPLRALALAMAKTALEDLFLKVQQQEKS